MNSEKNKMDESVIYPVPEHFSKHALIDKNTYQRLYAQSVSEPEQFWAKQAHHYLNWDEPWHSVVQGEFAQGQTQWFRGGKLNASVNCLDRHLAKKGNQIALIWEGDDPALSKSFTYRELHEQVCRFANVLKQYQIKKGDTVCLYLPMIPEAVIAMLACARIGAIHSVVFAGFSAEALRTRLLDTEAKLVVTADEGIRGNKIIPLKRYVDDALTDCPFVQHVLVVARTHGAVPWQKNRDHWLKDQIETASSECTPEKMEATAPLFILYTSGSTGKPKGIVHATGGYLLHAAMSYHTIFDYHEGDIFWCTADVGWITGHTYLVYGPLMNGATIVLFEGVPHYPTPARFWEIIDKYKVTIFYTAPTAIRALRREGDQWVKMTTRQSLRLLGSVGEPINPEAWIWYHDVVGEKRCPIVDTWWQTETGGIMISPFPGATPLKPGSATWPFFGVRPEIVDQEGNEVPDGQMGNLVITQPWPGMMQTIHRNPVRFIEGYFKIVPGKYLTGDQAYRDKQGYYWILGRNDDVLKISGHRIGTSEVESAIIAHSSVSEVAVVGVPDEIKGQSIVAFVTLKQATQGSSDLKKEIIQQVRLTIGAIAAPQTIYWAEGLPKTRSGKIMRRLLRKIAANDGTDLGDLTTLADPDVVNKLLQLKKDDS